MTIADGIAAELPFLRAEAEALMLDRGKALRPTGTRSYDPEAQSETDDYDDLFGTPRAVPCKVKASRSLSPRGAEAGDRSVVTIPAEVHLPAKPAYAVLRPGDVFEITKVGPMTMHPVGRRYRITSEVDGTFLTACRYTVERIVS